MPGICRHRQTPNWTAAVNPPAPSGAFPWPAAGLDRTESERSVVSHRHHGRDIHRLAGSSVVCQGVVNLKTLSTGIAIAATAISADLPVCRACARDALPGSTGDRAFLVITLTIQQLSEARWHAESGTVTRHFAVTFV
jgi:hypothetical protein